MENILIPGHLNTTEMDNKVNEWYSVIEKGIQESMQLIHS